MCNSYLSIEDIVLLGIVSIISGFQLGSFARRVENARKKYKVSLPMITGDTAFVRHFVRAQQNCLEFYPIFMVCLWVSGMFLSQVLAAAVGLFYIYSRQQYFDGYVMEANKRGPFKRTVLALKILAILSILGLIHGVLRSLYVVDLKQKLRNQIGFCI